MAEIIWLACKFLCIKERAQFKRIYIKKKITVFIHRIEGTWESYKLFKKMIIPVTSVCQNLVDCRLASSLISYLFLFFFTDNSVEPSRPVSSFSLQPWHSCHKLIYVRPNPKTGVPVGHWPIPESFWPDQNSPSLVSRACLKNIDLQVTS